MATSVKQLYSRYGAKLLNLAYRMHVKQAEMEALEKEYVTIEAKMTSCEEMLRKDGQEEFVSVAGAELAKRFVDARNLYNKQQKERNEQKNRKLVDGEAV